MQRRTRWATAALALGLAVAIAAGVGAGPASSQSGPSSGESGDEDQELTGSTWDQAVAAALKATGGGTVTDTETGDDGAAYGVEVLLPGRGEVEVNLDRNLSVMGQETDDSGDDDELTGAIRDQVIAAALKATGGGTVTDTETGDDGATYGVEVRLADGREVEVNLDQNLNVIGQETDD